MIKITAKDYPKIKDLANKILHEKFIVHRDFIMFEALRDFIKKQGIEPGFEIEYPNDYFNEGYTKL